MDPTWKSPHAPPENWAKKFYQKPPAGKHRTRFRFFRRNERGVAIGMMVFCLSIFYYPILKPFTTGWGEFFRMDNDQLRREWHKLWVPKSKEELWEMRQRGGMHVHKLSDILDGSYGYRPEPKPAPPSDAPSSATVV